MKHIKQFNVLSLNESYGATGLLQLGKQFLKENPISSDDNDGFGDCIQTSADFIEWVTKEEFEIISGAPKKWEPGLPEFHAAVLHMPTLLVLDLTAGQFGKDKITVYTKAEFEQKWPLEYNLE